ncbi:MAG: TatD family hydrolase [Pseudomonadota bacterium]
MNKSNLGLIDICVNLFNGQFRHDIESVLERAAEADVVGAVLTASDLDTSKRGIEFCSHQSKDHRSRPACLTTAGIHPHDASLQGDDALPAAWQTELEGLIKNDEVCAVGETGLDFYRNFVPRQDQIEVFEAQIEMSVNSGKPMFVHDRESDGTVLEMLSRQKNLPATVIHCFTGSQQELEAYIDADFYIGITGWITDPIRGLELYELVKLIPQERLLIETDAPFLKPKNTPPQLHTQWGLGSKFKQRCEPAHLGYVAQTVADARDQEVDHVIAQTTRNASRLFGFNLSLD